MRRVREKTAQIESAKNALKWTMMLWPAEWSAAGLHHLREVEASIGAEEGAEEDSQR